MFGKIHKSKRGILPVLLFSAMMLAACSNTENGKMTFDALKQYGFINVGNCRFEDYTKMQTTGAGQAPSFSKYYMYDTGKATYEITFSDYKEKYHASVILKNDEVTICRYFTFEKDSKGKLINTDGYIRYINVNFENDKYGADYLDVNENSVYVDFDAVKDGNVNSPIMKYMESYEETGTEPEVQISLDGVIVKPDTVRMYTETGGVNVKIDFDVDSYLSMDYIKIGDILLQIPSVE